ncbi:serine hydrolase [Sphingomonas sp.]|uniref:serine hydrolase n=1 Tax=Sphingomonas sp. TaxID=28214 RepID=UPI001AFE075A|nr:serine hydrolase [Sphingomonas sp.]MBO9711624.1 serine hydrolase [Sphingomonas sp.]
MNKLLATLALSVAAVAAPALADPPKGFEARVEAVRQKAGVPGMAIAIVEGGKTTLARGWGIRKLGTTDKVDAHTIFMIGSTGKAITTAALATLVDSGKIGWDDKVVDHIPWFQMYDPWVTREMTVRDLLVHRSGLGLGQGDLLMVPRGSLSRAETVKRIRYLKPATSFRSSYAYDNILYIVAGQLIEEVTGQSWEDYVREHVFGAAGMLDGITDDAHHFANPNRAWPHAKIGGTIRGLADLQVLDERDQLGRAGAPAGMIGLSATDMATWLKIQLAHGALPDGKGRLFSEAASAEMWAPVTPMPIHGWPGPLAALTPTYLGYALGWEVQDYAGHQILWHAGGLFGSVSVVVLIPEKNVGFGIELNSEDSIARLGLMYELLDHYLGQPPHDWPAKFEAFVKQRLDGAAAAVTSKAATPAGVGPSLPADRYTGTYVDPWYGRLVIGKDAKGLTVDFTTTPNMRGRLEHWQYDSFIARFDDKGIEPAYLSFALDADGAVKTITLKPVSPLADFSFDYQDLLFTPAPAGK